jgi:hypothetical protein
MVGLQKYSTRASGIQCDSLLELMSLELWKMQKYNTANHRYICPSDGTSNLIVAHTKSQRNSFPFRSCNMATARLSAEVVVAIVFSLLQLGVGLVSFWQQRQLRRACGRLCASLFVICMLTLFRREKKCETAHVLIIDGMKRKVQVRNDL